MSTSRRNFLQSGAALAGLTAGASAVEAQAAGQASAPAQPLKAASEIQVPKMKFFHAEISRVVLGVNPFYGYSHYNNNFGNSMKERSEERRVGKECRSR